MDLANFATDRKKENEGVWVRVGETCELLLGRVGSAAYVAAQNRLREPLLKSATKGRLTEEQGEVLFTQVLAETVLLGWRGEFKLNGKDIPYSKEAALTLLSEPSLEWFKDLVANEGAKLQNFSLENFEDILGKLLPSSSTNAA